MWKMDEAIKQSGKYTDQEVSALEDSRIVEYGENENGHYWRWESGLQICRGTLTVSFQDGGSFAQSYPATFSITTSAVTVSFGDGVNPIYRQAIANVGVTGGSNGFGVYLNTTSQVANNTARWSAVGRWK
jgi:hypothetical protein